MKKILKKNLILIIAIVLYGITFVMQPDIFNQAAKYTLQFLKEMIEILPLVSILSALITVWIPREVISRYLGKEAGIKGKIIAVLTGGLSAGPIYAAFPVCLSLLKKGASLFNVVVILSSWAVIKLPMLFVESRFLGFPFALTRYLLTLPFIFLIAWIIGKNVSLKGVLASGTKDEAMVIMEQLPGYNCKGCGLSSCAEFSTLVASGEADIKMCKLLGKKKD